MKVSTVVVGAMLVFGGMMVAGALVPELDPAPTASAHTVLCSPFGDEMFFDCIRCLDHQAVYDHYCVIYLPMPQ